MQGQAASFGGYKFEKSKWIVERESNPIIGRRCSGNMNKLSWYVSSAISLNKFCVCGRLRREYPRSLDG